MPTLPYRGLDPQPRRLRRAVAAMRLLGCAAALTSSTALAHRLDVPAPDPGNRAFGADIVVLPNGHYLVHDPEWSAGVGADLAGAVYLYDGDGKLLSRLAGSSSGDRIGSAGIVVLPSGDFVVQSPEWQAPGADAAGAVSWGDADTGFGLSAVVNPGNSLVGTSADDRVGDAPIVVLANGSFVVPSGEWDVPGGAANVGAVTWCAADGSTVGAVGPGNSLVGSSTEDRVGFLSIGSTAGVVALANDHYVVLSSRWDDVANAVVNAGAVTWARGDGSTLGAVTAANSLIGARADDYVGSEVKALSNGHYVVLSFLLDSASAANVGAATWANGSAASVGTIGAHNSLMGTQAFDRVGVLAAVLSNGNYVVASPFWDAADLPDVGAVTWRDGDGPGVGLVDATNSLIGEHVGDTIGQFVNIGIPPLGVIALSQGDYVVASPAWDDGDVIDVGAVTLGDGDAGTSGVVSAQNSMIGSTSGDEIAQFIVPLANGNFVVASPLWSEERGAATWGSATGSLGGVLGAENSLVGSTPEDFVSASGVYPLLDGGYVVASARWRRDDDTERAGAVTRGAANGGITGAVSVQNSIVGTQPFDVVGAGGAVALPDGGFLVQTGFATGQGGITRFAAGSTPVATTVSVDNSLIGQPDDRIGPPGAEVQVDGAIVVFAAVATPIDARGAITLLDASDRFVGVRLQIDTVRSARDGGGPALDYGYLPASRTLVVGDPLGNRVVRLNAGRILADGFEAQ